MTTQLELPNVPTQDNTLVTLLSLAKTLNDKLEERERLEKELATNSEDIKQLREKLIPDLMQSIGLTEFKMVDGRVLSISPVYYASVPKARSEAAFEWLRSKNMGGIIKEAIEVSIDHKDSLVKQNIPFAVHGGIHPSTLRAFVKERIETGDTEFPKDLFGATVINQAVLKNP